MLTGQVAIDMAKSVEDLACCDSQRGQIDFRSGRIQIDSPGWEVSGRQAPLSGTADLVRPCLVYRRLCESLTAERSPPAPAPEDLERL